MTKRAAPYRHEDGSTCWTKGCSRGNFFVGTSSPAFTLVDFFAGDTTAPDADPADIAYLRALLVGVPETLAEQAELKVAGPLHVVDGATLNAKHAFRNRARTSYEPARHEPVKNVSGQDLTWVKPTGAFWLSTVGEDGRSGWDALWGSAQAARAHAGKVQHTVRFAPEAKVLVIDSRADYLAALETYPHRVERKLSADEAAWFPTSAISLVQRDGTPKRGLDYERMAQDYDALFLTERGLFECGKRDFSHKEHPGDVSLYIWDIESAVVFRPEAVVVEQKLARPRKKP